MKIEAYIKLQRDEVDKQEEEIDNAFKRISEGPYPYYIGKDIEGLEAKFNKLSSLKRYLRIMEKHKKAGVKTVT